MTQEEIINSLFELELLDMKMNDAVKKHQYEDAIIIRDRLREIRSSVNPLFVKWLNDTGNMKVYSKLLNPTTHE